MATISAQGCPLAKHLVATRDVPHDGDCLFHAWGGEVQKLFPDERMPENVKIDMHSGSAWRQFMLKWLQANHGQVLEGVPLAAWLGEEVGAYCTRMRRAKGRDTWGGMLETVLLGLAWGRRVQCVLLASRADGWQAMSISGSQIGSVAEGPGVVIAIAWDGVHWVRARLTKAALLARAIWQAKN